MSSNCNAIAISSTDIYACGAFYNAGGAGVNFIAKYNGTTWSGLSLELNSTCRAIVILNSDIYTGGDFSIFNGTHANRIAKYSYDYINLKFNSQNIYTLYNSSSGTQVNSYSNNGSTYVYVIENIPFYM